MTAPSPADRQAAEQSAATLCGRAERIIRRWSWWVIETQAAGSRPGIEGDRDFLLALLRRAVSASGRPTPEGDPKA